MSLAPDRRDSRRVILGPSHSARFVLKGHPFQEVRITNISMGGCFLMIGKRDEPLFKKDSLLENLVVEHGELPKDPMTGQVVYTLGTRGPATDYVGVGVRFIAMADGTQDQPQAFVVRHLGPMI